MEKTWLVIAVTYGDGEAWAGRHVWSERFRSLAAADTAERFLRRNMNNGEGDVAIIEDYV